MTTQIDFKDVFRAFFGKFDSDANGEISQQEIREIKLESWGKLEETSDNIYQFVQIMQKKKQEKEMKEEEGRQREEERSKEEDMNEKEEQRNSNKNEL